MASYASPILLILLTFMFSCLITSSLGFVLKEATLQDIQIAFRQGQITSEQLVDYYLEQIRVLNPVVDGVLELNPDAITLAKNADYQRKARKVGWSMSLHGIPILVKDTIATYDKLNTTAGSFALLGSRVPRDAGVVAKLRRAGAIVLGKSTLSEWADFRSFTAPEGWSARGGQGKNPYVLSASSCGSSSGSAISVAANMVAAALGTETDGSILCPASFNDVVGIKPTVGLTSRAGVVPISPRQDTIGPICRTVADAVQVLDAIVGIDPRDSASIRASRYIPSGGYKQFLKADGLRGKRLGIVRNPFFDFGNDTILPKAFENLFSLMRQQGAVIVDNLRITNIDIILDIFKSGEAVAALAEFKIGINAYLKDLVVSPVRSLADTIAFNDKNADLEMIKQFPQDIFLAAEATNGIGPNETAATQNLAKLSYEGFVKLMNDYNLDAIVTPGSTAARVLAIGGFPGISVPAAYDSKGVPVGMLFGGLKGSEATLIEIAYGFEQHTKARKPPQFLS